MKKRIDEPTGTQTVGHEWDGIEELDTPLPRWWLMIFAACIVFAIGYVFVYPAIPMRHSATKGLAGWSSRHDFADQVSAEATRRAPIFKAIAETPIEALPAHPALLRAAVEGGRAAFKVHCVQCHGSGAAGSIGYPNLNDDDWLWGGKLEDIYHTIKVGVRSSHPDTRFSQMPAFGRDGTLKQAQIEDVAEYVVKLHEGDHAEQTPAYVRGRDIFTANCTSCHGAHGEGGRDKGAPRLNDAIWLYGSDKNAIIQQVTNPRHGVMPTWENRLSDDTIKELTIYVHSLGGGE